MPDLPLPHAQRTSRLRESLQKLGEEGGGEAGARMRKQQGMAWSSSTVLRLRASWTIAHPAAGASV
ncbi:MAG TPA: hypothetical protein VFV38_52135 [Ktedonobacteraceae bacterium]|nr:hypothetical protein [Ktedonobacteraceae bacterium]